MDKVQRVRIELTGIVQGIGFRPWVYRLAAKNGLGGFVCNSAAGALIEIEGTAAAIKSFGDELRDPTLPGMKIMSSKTFELSPVDGGSEFRIVASVAEQGPSAALFLDTRPCAECLKELFDPADRRYLYPFISCCSCGPRYSICHSLPFDREATAMERFEPCSECAREYRDPANRRFHSQINSCSVCGPTLREVIGGGDSATGPLALIADAAAKLKAGEVIAVKGLGGYQFLASALDVQAISRLRTLKRRSNKPFVIMVDDLAAAKCLADMTELEQAELIGTNNPVVIVNKKTEVVEEIAAAFTALAPEIKSIGLMLPSSPLHALLVGAVRLPLVVTSANLPGEPMIFNDDEAEEKLSGMCSAIISHDREIIVPLDDSVVQVIGRHTMVMRAGRGYAPLRLQDNLNKQFPDKLSFGAHQRNTSSLYVRGAYLLGPYIGDLSIDLVRERAAYVRGHLQRQFAVHSPQVLRDFQDNYASSRDAEDSGFAVQRVQHHLAHCFATVLEHQVSGDFLAVSWDGFGLGTDGKLWGGEFFRWQRGKFARVATLRSFSVLAGEAMAVDTGLSALSLLSEAVPGCELEWIRRLKLEFLDVAETRLHLARLKRGRPTLLTSSAGRLIDGISCLLGLASQNRYEGFAGILLNERGREVSQRLPYEMVLKAGVREIDWRPLVREIIRARYQGVDLDEVVGRFWYTMASLICDMAISAGVDTVVLGGGCFQGAALVRSTEKALGQRGLRMFLPSKIPAGDGGISIGQIAASHYLENLTACV